MRKGGGREKGFRYERDIAKILGEWWCGDPLSLWRNTNSGARATVVGKVYGGDIAPANNRIRVWPLCVEVKKSEGWSFDAFMHRNPGNELLTFMLQCLHASTVGCNNIPLLICTKNRKKPLCFLHATKKTADILHKKPISGISRLCWNLPIPPKLKRRYPTKKLPIFYVLPLKDFLGNFFREDFL